jgi:hypothetical protein
VNDELSIITFPVPETVAREMMEVSIVQPVKVCGVKLDPGDKQSLRGYDLSWLAPNKKKGKRATIWK